MPERKAIAQRLRFEVFKRDKFTCQYCGRAAPDVILNCDHLHPIAEGGDTDILNLITSCRDCNGGKGKNPLETNTVLDKQRAMLGDLEERRQQIEMMIQWRDELRAISGDVLNIVCDRLREKTNGVYGANESGKAHIRRWLRRFTVAEVLDALDESFDVYLRFNENEPDSDSWEKAFRQIPKFVGISRQEKAKPHIRRLLYIQAIIRNRAHAPRYNCVEYLEHLVICGADLNDMETRAKRIGKLEDFEGPYDSWLEKVGRRF